MASVIFPGNMKQSLYMQFMWQDCDTRMEITIRSMKGEKYVWNGGEEVKSGSIQTKLSALEMKLNKDNIRVVWTGS